MFTRRILLGALTVTAALVTGCSSSGSSSTPAASLPDAASLLKDAATATGAVTSAHFTVKTNGTVPGLSVQDLDGDLSKSGGPSGSAKGTGKLSVGGQLVEVEFVLVDSSLYIKGPTAGFQKIPAALGTSIYDPSAILDPARGISKVLLGIQSPKTEATEDVNGTPAYKVSGKITKDVLAGLLPGLGSDADITFWLQEAGKHLPVKASAKLPGAATVDVTLSNVDKPVTVTAPA
jgi:lipoprotein LprG